MQENSWLAEDLLAFQEGLCSMELVSELVRQVGSYQKCLKQFVPFVC
jgi:hypothetical protein